MHATKRKIKTGRKHEKIKKGPIGIILGIFILLLLLFYSPPTTSSQIDFTFFILALTTVILELWIFIPPIKMRPRFYAGKIIRLTTIKNNKKRVICVTAALILTSIFAYASFRLATEMQGAQGYVSDECWYVSSARNVLREVFGVQPSYVDPEGMHHYTIFFSSISDLDQIRENFRIFIENLGGQIVPCSYSKTPAISIAIPGELDHENLLETFPKIEIIQSGYNYPDAERIENFLNLEHPPLAKYIIGLSMLTLGDEPVNWRIPGIIAGAITILLVYLMVAKLIKNEFIALFVYLFAFTDPIFKAMSSIAMLDIYAAFFMTLSAWLAMRRNYFLSALAVGLAASCKLNGVFSAGALFLFMIIGYMADALKSSHARRRRRWRAFRQVLREKADKLILYPIVIPFLVWLLFNLPLIVNLGFQKWFGEVTGGLGWFITPKTGGSAPWGWFINQDVFWMSFNPDVSASVNSIIYFMALIALIFIPHLARKVNRNYFVPGLWFIMTFLGFTFVYILGNRSLYSFYAVALSPMVYVLAGVLVYYLIENVLTHIKFMIPHLRNPKPILIKIRRNPKSPIRKFLKIHKSADPFVIRPRQVSKKRRTKRTKKRRLAR
jgi:predicted membrane-bound dolichyl-phosphate-mannose-protein mannosyltransferase